LIARTITPELLRNIADEHQRGRRLFVVTTNLDAARPVIWNMGVIAQSAEAGLRLFRQVLLASASIPGMFQPVMIEVQSGGQHFQEMHADGGATAPFYVAPESFLLGATDHRLPASAIYIVINGKLTPSSHGWPARACCMIIGAELKQTMTVAMIGLCIFTSPSIKQPLDARTREWADERPFHINIDRAIAQARLRPGIHECLLVACRSIDEGG
jgi:hypothetical protein